MNLIKSFYWEELNELLNPEYKKENMPITPLAIFGVHHWAFAFPVAAPNRLGNESPFPRITLLRSLAARFAMDLENGEIGKK